MAWVMLDWKRPAWEECRLRWTGRTWPRVKKVARGRFLKQMSWAPRPQRRFQGSKARLRGRTPHIKGSSKLWRGRW